MGSDDNENENEEGTNQRTKKRELDSANTQNMKKGRINN
jgi:hypothetical protein